MYFQYFKIANQQNTHFNSGIYYHNPDTIGRLIMKIRSRSDITLSKVKELRGIKEAGVSS